MRQPLGCCRWAIQYMVVSAKHQNFQMHLIFYSFFITMIFQESVVSKILSCFQQIRWPLEVYTIILAEDSLGIQLIKSGLFLTLKRCFMITLYWRSSMLNSIKSLVMQNIQKQ